MVIEETKIPEIKIIKPKVFTDNRGYFFESYNQKTFHALGIENNFIQDNESFSKKGVIRGLHYQLSPYAQSKLVRVVKGKIFDVAVDIRKNSPTFGQWVGVELSDENKHQLLIPKGFAHGFVTLSEYAIVNYKCDELYNPEADRGIRFNDPQIGIDWLIGLDEAIVSAKDNVHPYLKDAEINFDFGTTY
ncbi:dTDP-4-dehydrorhamnose 3,5-epimerase [Tenuifilum thalassicum]|uniref:dTDP-4-dehydrorhamnose 3,5-epimerase n=1 Tax=Tenuifilum thalassicum TaxID=2590900 RepID=A0A7D3XL82_9BACT|nr:dTDP-4-dehydrorhamnose 3,5-epimerase [Tenuifilum thalassicum]QKG80195.1 dTDP-4-dehydrorhamnose 3,5-epimerase [Tenuifilum thalassicum]